MEVAVRPNHQNSAGPLPLVGVAKTAFSESCSVAVGSQPWCCLDTGRTLAYSGTMQFPDIHRITLNPKLMGGKPCIRVMR
jgi:hypothetical protein